MDEHRFPELIKDLYRLVGELEAMFPGRHFTPDGHMVGSIGECLAAYYYNLELLPASSAGRDAVVNGRDVEIKATQGTAIGLRSCPEHLLVLKLDREGGFREIYNGPGRPVWELVAHKPRPSNGMYQIQLSHLKRLMGEMPENARIRQTVTAGVNAP
jgi:hypothetical protein